MVNSENNHESPFVNVEAENEMQSTENIYVENDLENNNENQFEEEAQSTIQPTSENDDENDHENDDENDDDDDDIEYMTSSDDDDDDEEMEEDEDWDNGNEINFLNYYRTNRPENERDLQNESDTNDSDDERTFREIFEQKFGTEHPEFFTGTFFEAAELAHQRSTFVVVYTDRKSFPDFRSEQHFLTRSQIIEYFNRKNAVLWASLSSSDESKQFKDIFNVRSEIFFGIYMENHQSEIVLVKDIFLLDGHENILLDLIESEEEHLRKMEHLRQMEQRRLERQQIIAEQDRAYEESLRIDRAKSERKLAEEKAREELRIAEEAARALLQLNISATKEEARRNLVPEPNEHDSSSGIVTLAFKFSSGTKMSRKFLVSHTLADLHYFVLAQTEIDCVNVELKTNFPSKVLPFDPKICIGDSSLRNRDLIFVYTLKD